jgi:hypothetical protein
MREVDWSQVAVLQMKIRLDNIDLTPEPILIANGGRDDRGKIRHGCLLHKAPR